MSKFPKEKKALCLFWIMNTWFVCIEVNEISKDGLTFRIWGDHVWRFALSWKLNIRAFAVDTKDSDIMSETQWRIQSERTVRSRQRRPGLVSVLWWGLQVSSCVTNAGLFLSAGWGLTSQLRPNFPSWYSPKVRESAGLKLVMWGGWWWWWWWFLWLNNFCLCL